MKRTSYGKLYDTESAKKVGESWNNPSQNNACLETLYLKKTGEYFLHQMGSELKFGEQTIPFASKQEAKEWAEKHLPADEYIKEFGERGEAPSVALRIKTIRKKTGMTQARFAEKYGIPKRTLESWEMGERVPPEYIVNLLEKIEKE